LFRGNQIGLALLKLAEKYAISVHSKKLFVKYNDFENNIEKSNRFFCKNGWGSVKYTHTHFCFKRERFKETFIVRFYESGNRVFDDEINFMSFRELSEEKKIQIKEQSKKILSNGLLPFNDLDAIVKDLSIFVFLHETLIAWVIVNQIKYNEISIRSTFVVNEYRNTGMGIHLWYLIFCKINENHDFDAVKWVSFDFQKENEKLSRLYTTLLRRFLEHSSDYYISEKILV
jgi:hypothetical protein